MKKNLWGLIIPLLICASCSAQGGSLISSDSINASSLSNVYFGTGWSDLPYQDSSYNLKLAVQGLQRQETSQINYVISAGHSETFATQWKNNDFKSNPGYGNIAVTRNICTANNTSLDLSVLLLPSIFTTEDNYCIIYRRDRRGCRLYDYPDSFSEELNLNEYTGADHIVYSFALVDENKAIITQALNCGTYDIQINLIKDGSETVLTC